jgi:RimJ/RimL family protein N-acetyltransferase
MTTIIETERLILRTWKKEDAEAYFQINQDPKVIEFLRGPLTMEQVNDFIPAVNSHGDKRGYTLWAACLKETGELMGFIGLNYTDWESHFTPAVEVGWRFGAKDMRRKAPKLPWNMGLNSAALKKLFLSQSQLIFALFESWKKLD